VKHFSGAPLKGGLLASPTNICSCWKGLPGTNTLAYYENSQITSVKSFKVPAPGSNPMKLFTIFRNKLEYVQSRPLQPSIMFVDKGGAYPSDARKLVNYVRKMF
jgi:hypothetical protein